MQHILNIQQTHAESDKGEGACSWKEGEGDSKFCI